MIQKYDRALKNRQFHRYSALAYLKNNKISSNLGQIRPNKIMYPSYTSNTFEVIYGWTLNEYC